MGTNVEEIIEVPRANYLDGSEGVHDLRLAIDIRVENTKNMLKFLRHNETHRGHVHTPQGPTGKGLSRLHLQMNAFLLILFRWNLQTTAKL